MMCVYLFFGRFHVPGGVPHHLPDSDNAYGADREAALSLQQVHPDVGHAAEGGQERVRTSGQSGRRYVVCVCLSLSALCQALVGTDSAAATVRHRLSIANQ